MLETKKYVLTVEGETEQWYFLWLKDQINNCADRTYNVSIVPKVQQSPRSFYKGTNSKVTPEVIHINQLVDQRRKELHIHTLLSYVMNNNV